MDWRSSLKRIQPKSGRQIIDEPPIDGDFVEPKFPPNTKSYISRDQHSLTKSHYCCTRTNSYESVSATDMAVHCATNLQSTTRIHFHARCSSQSTTKDAIPREFHPRHTKIIDYKYPTISIHARFTRT